MAAPIDLLDADLDALSGYYGDFKTREGGKNKGKRGKGGKK